jgi:pimeloyl-ACP methyl ester carboxylesterase
VYQSVFKSEEGKRKIQTYYQKLLKSTSLIYTERYVDTHYGKTYLLEVGKTDAPVVFLIHGSCTNSAMWFADIGILSKYFHVFTVDIIGEAGNSDENRLDLKSIEYAQWLKEVFDVLDIDKAVMIGNSLGGWMSLKFATEYPNRVEQIVLIATSGISPVKLPFVFKSILYTMQGKKGINSLNKMIYGSDDIPEEALEVGQIIMKNFKPMVGSLPTYTDEQLKQLTMPVMYIAGENDVTVDVYKTAARIRENISSSNIKIIKNHGHVVYGVMNEVVEFIDSMK